ncbi:hypothetical protein [Deinococcus sp. AJ005]|uniref:hypothetical protein n=1 Tax=Deinococcus sp. AJ005 TaxID=2652443 RepID=UPI00125CC419|nr:hypothetical protein [Deinococcus sp. AJ005]QFP77012.1 hypothetical protein DAAJ005_11535 [Deinococcus sp. AJ005]
MYHYIPQNIHAGDKVVTLIIASNHFFSHTSTLFPPRVLGVYDNESTAVAAYDVWCAGLEGTTVHRHDPWYGLELEILPCTPANVPALIEAATTGQAVYIGSGKMFAQEMVMTEDTLKATIDSFGWEQKGDQGGTWRPMNPTEIDFYVRKFIQKISEDVLRIFR